MIYSKRPPYLLIQTFLNKSSESLINEGSQKNIDNIIQGPCSFALMPKNQPACRQAGKSRGLVYHRSRKRQNTRKLVRCSDSLGSE